MSQIYKSVSIAPPPPAVATQYTADDATVGIPSSNNFNLKSRDTTVNNTNGIQTTTDANGSANHYSELTNRITGTATTTDDSTAESIYSFDLGATPGTYFLDVKVVGFNSTSALSAGFSSQRIIKTNGVTSTEINATPMIIAEEGSMTGVVVANGTSGNNATLTAQGYNADKIDWRALTTYIFVEESA